MVPKRLASSVLFLTFASVIPLVAGSYYPARLEDARAIYLTPDAFPVKGDGVADDSTAVQQAIDTIREKTNQGILFVPSGTYRLKKTIYIWPGIRLIGYGATRPRFVLAANTPGYQQGPKYMFFFAGAKPHESVAPPDASPGTFYSALSNLDIEIQAHRRLEIPRGTHDEHVQHPGIQQLGEIAKQPAVA